MRKQSNVRPAWAGFVPDSMAPLSAAALAGFAGKHILITGAGGFLGSALARRLAKTRAAHLTLLDLSEYGLYRLDEHLRTRATGPAYALVIGDVADRALLAELFTGLPPDIIFHAAARKHVPLMENNIFAAAETNVLGTLALVEAAQRASCGQFLLLSTDKAVAPISIMGATKRIAEQIVLSARENSNGTTNFKCLRLCNVLGSTGSVAPLFVRQIANGGPVTVTDAEATRFFISQRNAVRHLLHAALTKSRTGLLIPKTSHEQRVEDLAKFLIGSSAPAGGIPITHTGLRAADKLQEQLLGQGERADDAPYTGALGVTSSQKLPDLQRLLPTLAMAVAKRDCRSLLETIQQLVPDYRATLPLTATSAKEPA